MAFAASMRSTWIAPFGVLMKQAIFEVATLTSRNGFEQR